MEEEPVSDHMAGAYETVPTGANVPAMFVPPRGTLWQGSAPFLVVEEARRYTLGWQNTKKDGPCFVVLRIGLITNKVLDRFPLTEDGWAHAWNTLAQLDRGEAQAVADKVQKQGTAGNRIIKSPGSSTVFQRLGVRVVVEDGKVYAIDYPYAMSVESPRLLGSLAGANAMVTDGSQAWSPGRAMFLPISLSGLATKIKADAAVVFSDGTVHTAPLDGNLAVREAQKQAVQFNAMAGATTSAAEEPGRDPAARLRRLQELKDAGLLTQGEYETKRAEIINAI